MRSARAGSGTGAKAAAATAAALCGLLLAGCANGTVTDPGSGKSPGPRTSWSPESSASPSDGTGTPPSTAPPTGPPPSSPAAPATSVPGKSKRLVAATVSGGIDGRHRSVLVNADGSYTALDRKKPPKTGQMKPDRLAELRTALAESDFAKLPRTSLSSPPIADGITTAVIYQGREVVTDGMKKIPGLDRIIAALPGLNQP
ncbi:hypothetical protein [Streptomyces sp. NPDC048442]|uniref:hypothetical protein n=1 Tax=Streptomyces sp. NPDC048442 TaxID=3154823 RepID=UPI0034136813